MMGGESSNQYSILWSSPELYRILLVQRNLMWDIRNIMTTIWNHLSGLPNAPKQWIEMHLTNAPNECT